MSGDGFVARRAQLSSLAVAAVFAAALDALYWWWPGLWSRTAHAGWYGDLGQLTTASHLVLHGQLGAIYGHDPGFLGLPLATLIMVPVDLLGLHGRTQVLAAGTYEILLASTVLYAASKLACEVGLRRRPVVLWVVSAAIVILPLVEYAHVEDVVALALTLHALRRILRHDLLAAALLLSAAVSFKQWAVVLLPFVVFRAGRVTFSGAAKVALAAAALPAVLAGTFLVLDGTAARDAFFRPAPSNPLAGHPGIAYTWLGLHSSGLSRTLALLVAVLLCWFLRRTSRPATVLAAVAAIFAVRPLGETVNYSYYWTPALLVVLVACGAGRRRLAAGDVAWVMAALAWSYPRGLEMSDFGWWLCEAIILAMCAFRVFLALRADLGGDRRQHPVDEPTRLVGRVGPGQLHSL